MLSRSGVLAGRRGLWNLSRQEVLSTASRLYERLPPASDKLRKAGRVLLEEVKEVVSPSKKLYSRRQKAQAQAAERPPEEDFKAEEPAEPATTAIMNVTQPKTRWDHIKTKIQETKAYAHAKTLHEKVKKTALYERTVAVKSKVSDKVEDFREVYETTQNPVVWRVRELGDTVLAETDTAVALSEIKKQVPDFSIPAFLEEMEDYMIPNVVTAWLRGDTGVLFDVCEENARRAVVGEMEKRKALGWILDDRILDIVHVNFHDASIVDGKIPVIICTFIVQHVHCAKDLTGAIVEGSESKVQYSHYVWALRADHESEDFNWKIVDFAVQGIAGLI